MSAKLDVLGLWLDENGRLQGKKAGWEEGFGDGDFWVLLLEGIWREEEEGGRRKREGGNKRCVDPSTKESDGGMYGKEWSFMRGKNEWISLKKGYAKSLHDNDLNYMISVIYVNNLI